MSHKHPFTLSEVSAWLTSYHGEPIADLQPMAGGYWSSAFSYLLPGRGQEQQLVLRLGESDVGYRIDQMAQRFNSEILPVPEVLDIGRALNHQFAISRRHYGGFIEVAAGKRSDSVCKSLAKLLGALRSNRELGDTGDVNVEWYEPPGEGAASWHDWLRMGVSGNAETHSLYAPTLQKIEQLLPLVPERRELIHGDLLHQNVLISDDESAEVTGVFSWKCSALGDFLYDVAWCTLWSPWFEVLNADLLWHLTLEANDLTDADLEHAAERHYCYELQIALSHIGWFITSKDDANLKRLSPQLEGLLDRGPRKE